jgi:hypothetical protein
MADIRRREANRSAGAPVTRRRDTVVDTGNEDDETVVDDGFGDEEEEVHPRPKRRDTRDGDTDDEPPRRSDKLPPGLRVGDAGAEETMRASGGGSGIQRIALGSEPCLIKFLEPENFANYRQHWVPSGAGQPDRPYVCIGFECPLCDIGDRTSATFMYNVLDMSSSDGPTLKILQIATKANQALREASMDRVTGKPRRDRDFWAVSRSGKGQTSQTNFRPVKLRDLEDDWEEVLDHFDIADLDDIVGKAQDRCFDASIVTVTPKKGLDEVVKFLAEG